VSAIIHRLAARPPEELAPFYRDRFGFEPVWSEDDAVALSAATVPGTLLGTGYEQGVSLVLRRGDLHLHLSASAEPAGAPVDLRKTGGPGAAITDPYGNPLIVDEAPTATSPRREPVDRHITVQSTSIHVRHWPAQGTPRATLRLIHGARAHTHWWDRMMELAPPDIEAIALDQSGHGDSGHRAEYDADLWISEVRHALLADASAQTPVLLIAHSFGGRLATMTAAHHPDLVRGIVLVDTGMHPIRATFPPGLRVYPDLAAAADRFVLLPPQPWPAGQWLRDLAGYSARPVDGGFSWKFDPASLATLPDAAFRTAMDDLRCPIHLIRGRHSVVTGPGDAAFLRAVTGLPVQDVVISGGFHHLPLDSPQPLLEALLSIDS
jgi:pimeloyl-ACP methyl ester carboxylesterase